VDLKEEERLGDQIASHLHDAVNPLQIAFHVRSIQQPTSPAFRGFHERFGVRADLVVGGSRTVEF
jgi:hypothetical protein